MVIEQAESDFPAPGYSSISLVTTGATYDMELQRINFDFDVVFGIASEIKFDVSLCTTHIIRAKPVGADLIVERSTDGDSWATTNTVAGGSGYATFAVFSDGATCNFYYFDGTTIDYQVSSDNGATWAAATTLDTIADVTQIAPTSLTVVHVSAWIDDRNQHLYRYDLLVQAESDIYFPAPFSGFDAETVGGSDVLTFAALGQVRYDTSRQGTWAMRQKNSRWSDPREMDILDEYILNTDLREYVRLSLMGGRLFCTYISIDSGYKAAVFSASSEGRFWQHRQPLGSISVPGKLILFGDYVFYVGAGLTYRSASTVLSLNSTINEDVTDRVNTYAASRQKMHQSTITLHNEDEALTDLLDFQRWQVVERVGYWEAGDPQTQTIALTEVDTLTLSENLPETYLNLSARDRLAWMADRTEADHYEEWESQLRHWDIFRNSINQVDQKEILYTGLAHTATQRGRWDTNADELRLVGNNKEGLALCSIDKFIGHTVVQEAIQVPTSGNNEWAGVVVRSRDQDNLWCAYYDQATDTIKLRKMQEGVWKDPVATTGALSWLTSTWYWIRVEVRLSLFTVYHSPDGVTWTLGFQHVDIDFGNDIMPYREGYVGHAGFGFSDEDVEPEEPPPYVPDNPSPGTETDHGSEQWIFGTAGDTEGVFVTNDIWAASPHYWDWSEGLDSLGSKIIYDLKIDERTTPFMIYAATDCGMYARALPPREGVGTWVKRVTDDEIAAAAGIGSFDWATAPKMMLTIEKSKWVYCQWFAQYYRSTTNADCWWGIAATRDNWQNVYSSAYARTLNGTHGNAEDGQVAVAQHSAALTVYGSGLRSFSGGGPYIDLVKSTDGGVTSTPVDTTYSGSAAAGGSKRAVHVPYHSVPHDDSTIYWFDTNTNYIRRSQNSGASFSNLVAMPVGIALKHISGPTFDKDRISVTGDRYLYEWTLAGGLAQFGTYFSGWTQAAFVMVRDSVTFAVTRWLRAGAPQASNTYIEIVESAVTYDKSGDWIAVTGSAVPTAISRYQYEDLQVYP